MAKQVLTIYTDDLDGSEGAQSIIFGLKGVNYQIDLAPKNVEALEAALAPFVAKATRLTGQKQKSGRRPSPSNGKNTAIREWAKSQNLTVSPRGRISAQIVAAYEAAN